MAAKKGLIELLIKAELVSPATARKNLSKKFSDTQLEKFLSQNTIKLSSGYKLSNETETASDFDNDVEA